MKTIKTTTLALAAAAALGALSMTAAPASAKGFHGGFKGGGFHGKHYGGFHGKHFGHRHWGWRHRHHGWGYGLGVAYLAADCYYVRTYRGLAKVCE